MANEQCHAQLSPNVKGAAILDCEPGVVKVPMTPKIATSEGRFGQCSLPGNSSFQE